jgi:hypothetical protein
MDDPKTWIAIYAAFVATGALFLNIRTWFESGPRLKVTVIPDGMVIGAGPQFDERDLIIATVTNLGKTPVLITCLLLWEMPTWWARLRSKPTRTFVVANPTFKGDQANVPFLLEQARVWHGVARRSDDKIPDLLNGNFFLGISTSHSRQPILRRIVKPAKSSPPTPASRS